MQSADLSRCCFFCNDPAPPEIYTLSLHDALPICRPGAVGRAATGMRPRARDREIRPPGILVAGRDLDHAARRGVRGAPRRRSEEHTSELQSHSDLVCRLLLEKKKKEHLTAPHSTR